MIGSKRVSFSCVHSATFVIKATRQSFIDLYTAVRAPSGMSRMTAVIWKSLMLTRARWDQRGVPLIIDVFSVKNSC